MSEPKIRLLVLDDETNLVAALLSTLRENGYEAAGATTPSDALRQLKAQRFDVLITDLHLPEMDGLAVVRAALAAEPGLITIVMTGHGSVDTAVDAMKAGAADYLLKPFKMRTVQTVITRAVAARGLRQQNELLQRRLAARTHELEATNKELEAFSYSVSHDLRAPLRSMSSFAELLVDELDGGNPAQLKDYAQRISRGAQRMASMIDDLLRMGRAFRKELELTPVDLSACCRDVAQKLGAETPDRAAEWLIADDMKLTGDSGLMTIALQNLLENAWKYSARAPITRIEVRQVVRENEVLVTVQDNGVGFSMTEASRLFTPFTRLPSAAEFEGTGVGLATVQRIVHRHGGRIWAEAEPGKGATFSFTLPRAAAQGSDTPGSDPLP